jgi:hypothetical protein
MRQKRFSGSEMCAFVDWFEKSILPAYLYLMIDYRKKISDYLQNHRIVRHLLFWLVIVLIYMSLGLMDETVGLKESFVLNMCLHIPQAMISYFFCYYLIPQFIYKKKYVYSIVLFVAASYVFPVLARILTVHVGEELVRRRPFVQESILEILTDGGKLYFNYLPVVLSVAFQFLFVKYFLDFSRAREKEILLSKEKTEAELKTLKAQLNPHFLFNTLNNIYSLSLDHSPKTPLAIGKLAEILDYVLYKCNDELVSVSSEITLLENYIELEKLRYDDRLEVHIATDVAQDIRIPPLILLSLVENAFKHGAGEDSGSPKIWIDIVCRDRIFKASISNTISSEYSGHNEKRIGLSNIRMQLDLIYADSYAITIDVSQKLFKVILEINP